MRATRGVVWICAVIDRVRACGLEHAYAADTPTESPTEVPTETPTDAPTATCEGWPAGSRVHWLLKTSTLALAHAQPARTHVLKTSFFKTVG
jgi:hypothetical protein